MPGQLPDRPGSREPSPIERPSELPLADKA
jgi:hypothetical protein